MRKSAFLALLLMTVLFMAKAHPYMNESKRYTTNFSATNEYQWQFGGNALYLKPENFNDLGSDIPRDITFNLLTYLDWGFNLYGRHLLPGGRFSRLVWLHFKDAKDETLIEPRQIVGNDPNLNGQGGTVPYAYNSQFDIVEYEYGQLLNLTEHIHMRVHGGLEYVRAAVGYRFSAEVTSNNTLHQQNENAQLKFNGVGPRIGLDLAYDVFQGWTLGVETSLAILDRAGYLDTSESVVQSNGGVQFRQDLSFEDTLAGPVATFQLHFSVTHDFSAFNEHLSLSAGYASYLFMTEWGSWGGLYVGAKWQA